MPVVAGAAKWIGGSALDLPEGRDWPAIPSAPDSHSGDLYSGAPGVVLFYTELFAATGDRVALEAASRGARLLAARLPSTIAEVDAGLYTGLAGQCYVIGRAARTQDDPDLLVAATQCVDAVIERGRSVAGGLEWNAVTDIIGGTAGIGSMLLWAAEQLGHPTALATAAAAGDRLVEQAIKTDAGSKWAMSDEFPRLMPNFSHGTAGIAYFLARLSASTGDQRYLDAAVAGARYLQSVAETEGEICLVFHHEPEGEELFYLSWCHGPAGTGRTFFALWQATGDELWLEWTHRSAAAILGSGIPEVRAEGFWNNVGFCCGSAGVADFFLDLYAASGRLEYLAFADRVIVDLMLRATVDDAGTRWVQAEHRVQPELLAAQTGLMQGAAGIGMTLLHRRAVHRGEEPPAALPDNPFRRR